FGHTIYRRHDPRFDLLLERVARLPDPAGRLQTVSELRTRAGSHVAQPPNVDLALGALTYVADLPPGCPLFAVARLAGFAAHYREEIDERPVRYRGLSY
ncbi:citrate/2-methylcitrate synthase, partial [Ilumatobacter sp.]|uniref:citrate/2-methylcitrate synthase n=1 Tax=Ilumatobacter sp. TaxID=1967498 RepID=UPI003C4737F0